MGISIDVEIFNHKKLRDKIIQTYNLNAADEELLDKILMAFGVVAGDRYIVLNNEYAGDYNPYYQLSDAIEKAFKLNEDADVFCKCFCIFDDDDDYHAYGVNCTSADYVLDELGVEQV